MTHKLYNKDKEYGVSVDIFQFEKPEIDLQKQQ